MKNEIVSSPIMVEVAKEIVRVSQTPKLFRDFLLECVSYTHLYDYAKGQHDPVLELTQIIEYVYGPWVDGGSEMVNNIGAGLQKLYRWYGAFDFGNIMGGIFLGYSEIIKEGGASEGDLDKHINGIASLMKINDAFFRQEKLDKPD